MFPWFWGVPKPGGTQQLLVFILKITILGCFGGSTILGNTHTGGSCKTFCLKILPREEMIQVVYYVFIFCGFTTTYFVGIFSPPIWTWRPDYFKAEKRLADKQ